MSLRLVKLWIEPRKEWLDKPVCIINKAEAQCLPRQEMGMILNLKIGKMFCITVNIFTNIMKIGDSTLNAPPP